MKEILIIKFKLPLLNLLTTIDEIVSVGYRKTGYKFAVEFNGSKGYLSNIAISCEGSQICEENKIWIENLRDEKGNLKNEDISIFHSDSQGIRIEVENSQPKSTSPVPVVPTQTREIPFIKIPISQLVEEPKTCGDIRRFSHSGFTRKALKDCTLSDYDVKEKLIQFKCLDGRKEWCDIAYVFGKVIEEAKEILLIEPDETTSRMRIVAVEEIKIKRTVYWKLIFEVEDDLPF